MSADVLSALKHVRHMMLTQGPLEFFVHHNTLHALEHENFDTALAKAQVLYGAKVYKSILDYKTDYDAKKIADEVLTATLLKYFKDHKIDLTGRLEEIKPLLFFSEAESLSSMEDQIFENYKIFKENFRYRKTFFRKLLLQEGLPDIDDKISHTIFLFAMSYFDQGLATWSMPEREKGILSCFKEFIQNHSQGKWTDAVLAELKSTLETKTLLEKCLASLKLNPDLYEDYLFSVGMRYKGWIGLNVSLEDMPEWNHKPLVIKQSFNDFLTLIVLCEFAYLQTYYHENIKQWVRTFPGKDFVPEYSLKVLKALDDLVQKDQISKDQAKKILENFRDIDRQSILHEAYEQTFYAGFFNAFIKNHQTEKIKIESEKLKFQCVFCIDDREESFRRYVEEVEPLSQTFGIAGHFGLDINHKSEFSAYERALCPNVIKPSKKTHEHLLYPESKLRKWLHLYGRHLKLRSKSSRHAFATWLLQFFPISFFRLSFSVLASPVNGAKLNQTFITPKMLPTALKFKEEEIEGGMNFSEQLKYGRGFLKTLGLTQEFAPVVYIFGHGSDSYNNPHKSAYDCGACGGARGAPNARLMALILNNKKIRHSLDQEGIVIPQNTVFVGGFHNTCDDTLTFFDLPKHAEIKQSIQILKEAAKLNAKERCRRFDNVPLDINPTKAFSHVLGRAKDYRQPRPEYCHASNALCVVGPRSFTRDLFLDRRSFLISYDNQTDTKGEILKNILTAAGPVCAGINLEYYFSYIDNEKFGCGSKLAHNIAGLVGVMHGFESDLQMGLSSQMVEIHDPYRLMLLVVSQKSILKETVNSIPMVKNLVEKKWINMAIFDVDDKAIYQFDGQEFIKQELLNHDVQVHKDNFAAFLGQRGACELSLIGVKNA